MTRKIAGRPLSYWVSILLFATGFGLMAAGVWNYFIADAVDSVGKQNIAREYSPEGKKQFVDVANVSKIGDVFARIVLPRLGDDYVRLIGEGTKWHPVLNEIGVGHYVTSGMPGEPGNFALAAHRGGFGGSFKNIHRIKAGDRAYVQTNDGWYTYVYRQTKIVKPEDIDVIAPVPSELLGAQEGGQYLTLTSCDPIYVNTNRIIVWFEFESFRPLAQGAPAAISWIDAK